MAMAQQENVVPDINVANNTPDFNITDEKLRDLPVKDINKLLKGLPKDRKEAFKERRQKLKRKQSNIETRSQVVYARQDMKLREEKNEKIAASKPKDWKSVSVKHRQKFERLLKVWENVKNEPESITIINGNGVCFKDEFFIGGGSCGTEVYVCLGTDGIERAIKRLPKRLCQNLLKNERDILNSPNAIESPRIVNYCHYDDDSNPDFSYLILKLCERNLEEYIKEEGEAITNSHARKMIRQVLEGLEALHTREPRILHRDLKPTNILVDVYGNLVLSDFGIGRFFPEGATTYQTINESGSTGWMAYECVDWDDLHREELLNPSHEPIQLNWKEKSDLQVAGMLAYYIISKGKHPFGARINRLKNLEDNEPVALKELSDPVIKDLLSQMLAQSLDKRPYVEQALQHPYFLSPEEQMKFLEAVGNQPEVKNFKKNPNCTVSRELDNCDPSKNPRSSLLPNNWKAQVHHDDLNTFCDGGRPPSSYDGGRYTDCLRFIRNLLQHWNDKPRPPLKDMRLAKSLVEYFLQLFPTLPLVLHQIIREHHDWKKRDGLQRFFPVVDRRGGSDAD